MHRTTAIAVGLSRPGLQDLEELFTMWGMCDPAFTPQMLDSLWLSYSHDRRGQAPGGRGHFLQEDAHEGIVARAAALPGATPDRTARDRSTSER
jgi:hypothetical protein